MSDKQLWNEYVRLEAEIKQLRASIDAALAAEREACAKLCEDYSADRHALYKGRSPYSGAEPGRATDYVQGESDGAMSCAERIRARGEQAKDGK